MTLTEQSLRRPHRRLRQASLAFAAIGIAAACTNSRAQAPSAQAPQLYLTNDTFPKKGYIEKSDGNGDQVAFRVCATAEQIAIAKNNLQPIQGTCTDPRLPWNVLTGAITAVRPDGSVEIETLDKKTISMTMDEWERGFKLQSHKLQFNTKTPSPKIGQVIGGTIRDAPSDLYVIDSAAMPPHTPPM
jgi:hypothetical protein